MKRTSLLTVSALTIAGLAGSQGLDSAELAFKEERVTLEYTSTAGEAVIVISAESETPLQRIEIMDPQGNSLLKLGANGRRGTSLSGLVLETFEFDSREYLEVYGAGEYELRGRTVDGRSIEGKATLSHRLPAPLVVRYPKSGAMDVSTELVVSWDADPEADGYVVVLEQDENDGLTVRLPADQTTFEVPRGVLRPNTASHVEVGIIGANGNCTLVEIPFHTR